MLRRGVLGWTRPRVPTYDYPVRQLQGPSWGTG